MAHLNNLGLEIRQVDGKGRGVIATRALPTNTLLEVSPVLLFSPDEYEKHGKHTVLDEYTFCWPGRTGTMALALGIGSLFNHSSTPNVSYHVAKSTQAITFTTSCPVREGEELCIFYSHKLWFHDRSLIATNGTRRNKVEDSAEEESLFGGLAHLEGDGDGDDFIDDDHLPFEEVKYLDDGDEEGDSILTVEAWVVDVPDPRSITSLLAYIREAGFDTPDLQHLKRVRRPPDPGHEGNHTFPSIVVSLTKPTLFSPPVEHPEPYVVLVPMHPGRTLEEVTLKSRIWPTNYAPRKRDRVQRLWTQRQIKRAERSMRRVWEEAKLASGKGELPIASFVPDEDSSGSKGLAAHDTRTSLQHPLRHATMNLLRKISEAGLDDNSKGNPRNGQHYLLTSRTLFITHEPCIMCSMALLHSRVKEVFYLYPMDETGGCGGLACLPGLKGVNHRFAIWKWKNSSQFGYFQVDSGIDA